MNVNLLTIDCDLAATIGTAPSVSKPDSNSKGTPFVSTLDNEKLKDKIAEKPTFHNIKEKVQNQEKAVGNSSQEFTESIDKKIKSENSCKNDNKTHLDEPDSNSDSTEQQAKQPNIIQSWLAEHLIAVTQNKEATSTKNKSKSDPQITQIIANPQSKSSSVTGQAVKSTEIKVLHTVEKGQLGIKTILPAKSNGENGLKAITHELSKSIPAAGKQPGTVRDSKKTGASAKAASLTEKVNTKELKPEIYNNTGNNISENKSVQKLNTSSVQIIAGQTKEQSNSTSNKSTSQSFDQMLSQHNPQTLITEQSSISAKNATTANSQNHFSSDVSADIGRQILESVQRSMSQQGADHQITVRLNPPELGKVLIKFQQQDSELTGLMEVNKSQTRFEIEQALPQIMRNLANCGIHIKRLDVMLSNEQQPGQGNLGNQSLQYGGAQQQYSANQGTSGNDSAFNQNSEWLSSNNSYENLSELQEALITDGSINMLV